MLNQKFFNGTKKREKGRNKETKRKGKRKGGEVKLIFDYRNWKLSEGRDFVQGKSKPIYNRYSKPKQNKQKTLKKQTKQKEQK